MNLLSWNEIQIFTFFFTFVRVTSLLFFLPLLGDRTIPIPVKILLGLAMSFIVYPLVWTLGQRVDPKIYDSLGKLVLVLCTELAFGMLIGFVARWVFDAVQFAGYFIGTSIGFSMASVLDPHSENQTISIAEMKYALAVLLFLAMEGHHLYISAILTSFKIVPITKVTLLAHSDKIIEYLIQMSSAVISLGVKLAAPILVVIFLTNMTFSVLARAVSQMNVLVVSFAANLVVGLFFVFLSLPGFTNMVHTAFDAYTPELLRFMRFFVDG